MHRPASSTLLALVLVLPSFAQQGQPEASMTTTATGSLIIIKDATPVKLRMAMTLSSADAKTGDPIELRVADDVQAGKSVVIPAGSKAFGTVLMPESKKKKGEVNVEIREVVLANGEKAALRAKEAAVSATRTLEFFPPAPPYPYLNGKDLIIPKDTQVTAFIDGELKLNATGFPQISEAAAGTEVKPVNGASEVDVVSAPAGADVEIDGIFIGQTPAAAAVPVGNHTILLRIAGYDPWQRMFHTDGSKVRFAARLTSSGATGETVGCWDAAECVNASEGIAAGTTTKPVAQQKKRQNPDQ